MATYLLADIRGQGDWPGAAKDLLMSWGTVAGGIIGITVKLHTSFPGTKRVVLVCEGVTPFGAQFIWKKNTINKDS